MAAAQGDLNICPLTEDRADVNTKGDSQENFVKQCHCVKDKPTFLFDITVEPL